MAKRILANAIARASGAVDRSALRLMERSMRRNGPGKPPADARRRLIALGERYAGADDFFPEPSMPQVTAVQTERQVGAARAVDLRFDSTYRVHAVEYRDEYANYVENLTVRARWFKHREPRPVAICLHGWGGGAYWLEERAFLVSYLERIGLDVILFQLPFHGQRAPRQSPRSGALFPSAHVLRTNEAFGQAIHDLRALAAWLRGEGVDKIGVMGMSLGGYTSALWASVDERLSFAVPIIPAVSMSALMWRHGNDSPQRRQAEKLGISQDLLDRAFEVHSPLRRPVKLSRERLMIVAGRGDQITPPDQAKTLWQHWGEPELHWFPGGHLAQVGRGDGFRKIRQQLRRAGVIS